MNRTAPSVHLHRGRGLGLGLGLAALALVACYKTPAPECALACEPGAAEACPADYTCRPDGLCKRAGVPDDFACPDLPGDVDAATIDAAAIDAAAIDAAIDAAAIDALDAATIDAAAIDAAPPIDAIDAAPPIDAFAGLRITTTNPVAFGTVTVGMMPAVAVSVTNDGAATTTAITVTVSGGDFTLLTAVDTCTGQTLAMGASCAFDVQFAPAAAGAQTGTAAVSATTGGNSSINLTGTGQ